MRVFIFLYAVASTARCCDVGWINAGGDFCYHIGTIPMDFADAQEVEYCNNSKLK